MAAESADRRGERPGAGPSKRFGGSGAGPDGQRADRSAPSEQRSARAQPRASRGARSSRPATSRGDRSGGPARRAPRRPEVRGDGDRAGRPDRAPRAAGPQVDPDVTGQELERSVREELRTMSREAAQTVSRHLVMSARLLDDDPSAAWEHAKAAVGRGGRLAVVREAAGIAAYRAGDYAAALAQFRAARRISGSDEYWPVMADCERGLGRPERALAMAGSPEVARLDREGRVEMRIVAAGARRDLGQPEAAVVTLQCPELDAPDRTGWSARLKFAYADALSAAGRDTEARAWFQRAALADRADRTDAAERVAELDGVVWIDLEDETGGSAATDLPPTDP